MRRPDGTDPVHYAPGDYGKAHGDRWWGKTPNGHVCGLWKHDVTEHEDGTITVAPSIAVSQRGPDDRDRELWHGYLERGVWRSV